MIGWYFSISRDNEVQLIQGSALIFIQLGVVEPELFARFEAMDRLGDMKLLVEITPDHLMQQHRFTFSDFDQSDLPTVISACEHIQRHLRCESDV